MRRNCNLELALFPPSDSGPLHHHRVQEGTQISPFHHHHRQEHQQPLTIFYDGKICVADVTELQVCIFMCNFCFFYHSYALCLWYMDFFFLEILSGSSNAIRSSEWVVDEALDLPSFVVSLMQNINICIVGPISHDQTKTS
uniref:Protein TIFY 5A-like protein n=1 Tax=Phaseolus vulgaris TaxID=3885 RepID=T2DML0_PHAVU|nr:protein TIFY 5A-like protein [Phaseolus vulgaris]